MGAGCNDCVTLSEVKCCESDDVTTCTDCNPLHIHDLTGQLHASLENPPELMKLYYQPQD